MPGTIATFKTRVFFTRRQCCLHWGEDVWRQSRIKYRNFRLRDQMSNADNFKVFFDTYQSGLNGFKFLITSSGCSARSHRFQIHSDDLNSEMPSENHSQYRQWRVDGRNENSLFSHCASHLEMLQEWNVQFGREIKKIKRSFLLEPHRPYHFRVGSTKLARLPISKRLLLPSGYRVTLTYPATSILTIQEFPISRPLYRPPVVPDLTSNTVSMMPLPWYDPDPRFLGKYYRINKCSTVGWLQRSVLRRTDNFWRHKVV